MSTITPEGTYYVNDEGEAKELPKGTKIISPDEQERNRRFTELRNQKALKQMEYKEYGYFIWGRYQLTQPYAEKLSGATITRLMLLATYIDDSGALMSDNHGGRGNKKEPLDKKMMQNILKLKDKTFARFWSELCDNQLISEHDEKYYLSQDMFAKGELTKDKLPIMANQDHFITRLYIDSIREIYEKSKTSTHATLSYIFRMIPFVNRKYNVLCRNPLEEDFDKIDYMTVGDFCEQVGYDRSQAARLFHELYKPTFMTKKGERFAVRYVSGKDLRKGSFYIFVSPYVYYAKDIYNRCQIDEMLELEKNNEEEDNNGKE